MDPAAARALARLRDEEGLALRELARLVVDDAARTPLRAVATPRWIAGQIVTALEAATHGDLAREAADGLLQAARDRLRDEDRPLRTWMPTEAEQPLRTMLARPWSPDEELTFRILDNAAFRSLMRDVLTEALTRFGRRMRVLEKGLGGIGGAAARGVLQRGRGLLSNMAEGLVGAVAEEVEHVLQERVGEFVRAVTTDMVRVVARHVADPAHAEAYGELRVAALDVVLDAPVAELLAEADKLRPEELVGVLVAAGRAAAAEPDLVERVESWVTSALDRAGDGTLGAWLEEVGLRDVWVDTTTELVRGRLEALVGSEAFERWWVSLFA